MEYDIPESISQRGSGEKDEENSRIQAISDELHRRCQLHEAQSGSGKDDVNHFYIEQREAEDMAKESDYWIPMDDIFDLGIPGPSGNENDTYVSNDIIYKVNNLLNSGGICRLLNKIVLHNNIFPETSYKFCGFAGYDGRSVMAVMEQDLIKDSTPATTIEIDTYMSAIGFTKVNNAGRYEDNKYIVWDVIPRNVLKDKDGDIFVIDAEIKER